MVSYGLGKSLLNEREVGGGGGERRGEGRRKSTWLEESEHLAGQAGPSFCHPLYDHQGL